MSNVAIKSTAPLVYVLCVLLHSHMVLGGVPTANMRNLQVEKKILNYIKSEEFSITKADRQCHAKSNYQVYLIDNFEQTLYIVPEVRTSHGEMLLKLLQSGRSDIHVKILNTSLSKGLAQVIDDLLAGFCVDAVVSSIPGSNYSYDQITSFFAEPVKITPENILYHRSALQKLIRRIGLHGFPSFEWLNRADVNSAKLRNDAVKYVFIEALGELNIPVILPYGNSDATHKGKIKSVNLLSLASNAAVFSGLDQKGNRVPGFPYSPLSSGDETAVYSVIECPHPEDPFKACLNIDNDRYFEYAFSRSGKIAFLDDQGQLSFAPPVLSPGEFNTLLARIENGSSRRIDREAVLTAAQYRKLIKTGAVGTRLDTAKTYVWLNSSKYGRFYGFDAQCWVRGNIIGTSFIPPIKTKEMLPPKLTYTE